MEGLNYLKSTMPEQMLTLKFAAVAAISVIAAYSVIKYLFKKLNHLKWDREASRVRRERDNLVTKFLKEYSHKISEEEMNKILSMDATTLSESIKRREVTSYNAVLTYCIRSATVGKSLNLIANINYSSALEMAQKADELICHHIREKKSIDELPALIGLPVSIKDHIAIKGIPNTVGYACLANHRRDYDSLIVKILLEHGAIPFVCSNIPEGIMNIDSSNCLWGKAENPWNRNKVVGGSSGGEAALVASRSSPVGIGSDIGGSIRIPSAFCGTYGFKPTSSRVSNLGTMSPDSTDYNGFTAIPCSYGPICRSANDLVKVTSLLLGHFNEDDYVDQTPFNMSIVNKTNKLKIGYLVDLPFVDTAPDVKNKLFAVIEGLKSTHEVVPFNYKKLFELNDYASALFFNAGSVEGILKGSQGQRLEPYNQILIDLYHMPGWLVKMVSKGLYLYGETVMAQELSVFSKCDRVEYINLCGKLSEAKGKLLSYMRKEGFDAILCPSWSCPAFDLGKASEFLKLAAFMSLFNAMDMPAASVPVGLCEDLSYTKRRNLHHDRAIENNMKSSVGLPVAVMVATLPKQDEKCLRLVKEIDSITKYDIKHSAKVMTKPGVGLKQ